MALLGRRAGVFALFLWCMQSFSAFTVWLTLIGLARVYCCSGKNENSYVIGDEWTSVYIFACVCSSIYNSSLMGKGEGGESLVIVIVEMHELSG